MADDPRIVNQQPISLKSRDKLQVVVFTAVFTAALVGGIAFFASIRLSGGPADDAPIVMAGGSFYIHPSGIGFFDRDATNHKLVHAENGKRKLRVYAVEVIDRSGKLSHATGVRPSKSSGQIVFTYCADSGCTGQSDTITVTFNNDSADNLSIVNTQQNIDAFPDNNGVLGHRDTAWFLTKVEFQNWSNATAPPNATCGDHSHCTVIIRTCGPGAGC